MADPKRPLTSTEAAALLGVSPETVVTYGETGKLDGFRLPSGHWRFHRDSVEKMLGRPIGAAS